MKDNTVHPIDNKRKITDYSKNKHANKCDNLNKMEKFLER
jgi:hypothetical protein